MYQFIHSEMLIGHIGLNDFSNFSDKSLFFDAEEFGDWLGTVRGETEVIVEEHRPVPLWQHMLVGSTLFALFVGTVAFSRIYLGWHHPSDVFFAWLLGSVGGFATMIITESTLFTKRQ